MKRVESVFTVINYYNNKEEVQVKVLGTGDAAIRSLRKSYPSSTYKHVLDGFLIDGNFKHSMI